MPPLFDIADRVHYAPAFLDRIGAHQADPMRTWMGTVVHVYSVGRTHGSVEPRRTVQIVRVQWDDGHVSSVQSTHLLKGR
jgi:hypothetical protein